MEVILKMPFFTFSNAKIQFERKELTWRSYTTKEVLSTIWKVKLIDKKKFARVALNEKSEPFMLHIAALEAPLAGMTIHLLWAAQIVTLKQDESLIKVPPEYVDYADVFSFDLAMELPKNIGINKHAIKLQDNK